MSRVSNEAIRRRFSLSPTRMSEARLKREIYLAASKIRNTALAQDFDLVCVHMVRLREFVEELHGKSFDHGDHWSET